MEPNRTGQLALKDISLRDLHILDGGVPPACEVDSFRWVDGKLSTIPVGRSLSKRRQPKVVAQFRRKHCLELHVLCKANDHRPSVHDIVLGS
jgi:hypothetical protein